MGFTADRLLLFGATGDLSQRMLLPSLCALHADDLLAPELKIVGTARSELSTSEFRNFAREALEKHLPAGRRGGVGTFLNRLSYEAVDATTQEGYDRLAKQVDKLPLDLPKFAHVCTTWSRLLATPRRPFFGSMCYQNMI